LAKGVSVLAINIRCAMTVVPRAFLRARSAGGVIDRQRKKIKIRSGEQTVL
jgi:hypothetical protein